MAEASGVGSKSPFGEREAERDFPRCLREARRLKAVSRKLIADRCKLLSS
jgi:hypothetical protein